jgi:alkylation response protein AidB-like acyl-CoA dehydrogenase
VDFRLTEDQEALRRGMRELLAARFDDAALRRAAGGGVGTRPGEPGPEGAGLDGAGPEGARPDGAGLARSGLDRALWRELGEAGVFSLRMAEDLGGVGLGLPEAVLVFEEAGAALLPGPLAASHLAAGLVPGAADGTVIVTAVDLVERTMVEHLDSADAVLVLGDTVRMLVPGALPAEPVRPLDPLSPLHRVAELRRAGEGPPGSGGGPPGAGGEPLEAGGELLDADPAVLRRRAALLTAAQQLGSAGRTLRMAVEYAGGREQFGQPIGAFQAVKHLCAEMLVRSETARSVVYAAAVTEDDGEIRAAKLLADEAAVQNARDCLQVHGGMGFTWEAEVHLHLKRSWLRAGQWLTAVTAEEELASAL